MTNQSVLDSFKMVLDRGWVVVPQGFRRHTGGISSFSGPALRSGLAVKFENTPPFSIPPPYTRLFAPAVVAADGRIGSNAEGVLAGVSWALLPADGGATIGSEFCLTRRWRSSDSSSSSSESSASNASARAGSLTRRLRPPGAMEEAREWKEGGGEEGGGIESGEEVDWWCVLEETWSSSSWALTWMIGRGLAIVSY